MEPDVLERILGGSEKPTNLPFALLNNITGNFSEEQEIGEGGFATVYKGVLPNGNVAVKRIRNSHTIDEKLFYREVDSLLTVNHPNVVRFLGFCASTEQTAIQIEGSRQHIYAEIRERLLCFEYISNGSLQKHITDELRGLKWITRYRLIKGICEGLLYLHKEKHIYHMDLKPSNILLDNDMVPKITDFGLSRLDEKSQTMSQFRCGTLGYCAPEYLRRGKMSFKSDMYSLGTIIIELVTGEKSIPDNNKNNVLRRWRHRWKKTGKENPLAYQQVIRCIDIGLLCQEIDPCKRPFIWDIIRDINEVEDINGQISTDDESTVGQISPYSEDDMLGIEPLELHFPFELNKQLSCSLQLTNDTNAYIAFNIQTTSPLPYCMQPNKDIMPPRSNCSVDITLQPLDKVPRHADELIVRSTKVDDGLTAEHITTAMFSKDTSNVVDEVIVDAFFEDTVTEVVLGIRLHCIGCVERIERRTKRMPGSSACLEQANQQDNVTSTPQRTPMASGQPALQTFVLRVSIHCHGCKKKVWKVLKSIEGVHDVKVDAQQHKVMVTGTVDAETLVKRLHKSGKQALPWQHAPATEAPAPATPAEDGSKDAGAADMKPAEPVKEPQADSSDKKPEQETAPEKKPETEKKAEKDGAKPSDEAKKDGGEGAATEPKAKGTKEAGNDEGDAKKKQSKPKDAPAADRSLSPAPAPAHAHQEFNPYSAPQPVMSYHMAQPRASVSYYAPEPELGYSMQQQPPQPQSGYSSQMQHQPPQQAYSQQAQPMQQWSPSYLYMPYPHASPESYYQDYYSPSGTHTSPPPPPPLRDSYRLFDDENPNSCSVM